MKPSRDYDEYLLRALKDTTDASLFLNAAMEEGDRKLFLLCLREVVAAQGGMAKVARLAKLDRVNLYRMLSESGNPEYARLTALLGALGLRLSVAPLSPSSASV